MPDNQDPNSVSESSIETEFPELYKKVDKQYHDYLDSIVKNPIRQFQKSSVDDFLKLIEEKGLGVAVAKAYDARDYSKGNAWEQAQMNVMNSILPPVKDAAEILKGAIDDNNYRAVKWFTEVNSNPKEVKAILEPLLKNDDPRTRFWAAIHLSKHSPQTDGICDVLIEGMDTDWIAYKLENSSTGLTGRGECARALARLGDGAKPAVDDLKKHLTSDDIDAADAAQVSGTLMQLTGDLNLVLGELSKVAERVLTAKRGFGLHAGDRDMLNSLKNFIERWKKAEDRDDSLEEKVKMLESEIEYHLH